MVTEAVLLVLAARYVGVPSGAVPALGIASALLIAYPLTALPFFGLGFVEAAVLTILSAQFGNTAASEITAALIIWRAATMLVPLVIGGLVLLSWRRHHDTADSAAPGTR